MLYGYVWVGVDIVGHEAGGWMSGDVARNGLAKKAFQGSFEKHFYEYSLFTHALIRGH